MNSRFIFSWKTLQRTWSDWRGSDGLPGISPDLPEEERDTVTKLLNECVAARHGAVTARQHAAGIGELYLTLNATGRRHFLEILADQFAVDQDQVREVSHRLAHSDDDETFRQQVLELREALISPRQQLLQQFNALPQGVKFLIDMRAELLGFLHDSPNLKRLDYDLQQLLATWFDVGFLRVKQLDWQSPAALLEKLMAYEAVHAISSWRDMRHRLEWDRQCYAFFHPVLPGEPLIFIEIALVKGLASSIQSLLDDQREDVDPQQADTAIFYSISNAQTGLKGISFGPFLIKKVVDSLSHSLPNLKTFSTLSPIPGFRRWLEKRLADNGSQHDKDSFATVLAEAAQLLDVAPTLAHVIDDPRWLENSEVCDLLKEPLLTLCARYLHERRERDSAPLDPVARFHLGNGARIEQLNWLGDVSSKGMRESCGLMINYLYALDDIKDNIEAYSQEKQIAAAPRIRKLISEHEPKLGPLSGLRKWGNRKGKGSA
ncbi:malonyl-CoA decarboxylase [Desulfuromonas acetoxidans]|uniref:malonyl-CoA decarboxylase n=1 Tax=Desulfuromonas acetoxidans TaxID=891 RepID=UPI002930E11D|nr:malonyl-CoA decarboxylase [Desulfuromonas acetoxidans]